MRRTHGETESSGRQTRGELPKEFREETVHYWLSSGEKATEVARTFLTHCAAKAPKNLLVWLCLPLSPRAWRRRFCSCSCVRER